MSFQSAQAKPKNKVKGHCHYQKFIAQDIYKKMQVGYLPNHALHCVFKAASSYPEVNIIKLIFFTLFT